jgi:Protein of unknown function (DUF1579)
MMTRTSVRSLALLLMLSPIVATAQQPPPPQPQTPRSQMPDLGRPTKSSDTLPLFNFESYFLGKWTFEWDVPDSPLGPAGTITGTTTFTRVDETFYLATTEATGPGGPITIKETIGYKKDNKAIARQVADSRGFAFTQIGTVGGDLGGYYNIYYDGAPLTVGGKTVRLRHTMRLLSPVNFKVETRISEDGGPFVNFGTPWWRKDGATR